MNRFKMELRKRGFKLECDYECLPMNGIETVSANAEEASYSIYHIGAGWRVRRFARDFSEIN